MLSFKQWCGRLAVLLCATGVATLPPSEMGVAIENIPEARKAYDAGQSVGTAYLGILQVLEQVRANEPDATK